MSKLTQKIAQIAFGDIFGRGISFISTIYLARVLGADSFGVILVALSFLGYGNWLADLGLTNIGIREIAKEPNKRVFRAREIFILKIILNSLVLGVAFITVPHLNLPSIQQTIILSFAFALIPYTFILEWYYNARQHFGKVAFSKILNNSTYLILVLIFVHSPADLNKIPILFICGASAAALLFMIFSIKEKPFTLPSRGLSLYKDLLSSAFTIGSGSFFTQTLQLLPPIVIGIFLTTKDAGIYGAAIKIIFIAMMVDRIFVNLLLPNLSAQWVSNQNAAKINLQKVSRIMLLFGGTLALFIAIASPLIISVVFSSEYAESAVYLPVLTILLFFTFLHSIFAFGLVAIGEDRHFFNSTFTGGIISILLICATAFTEELINVVYAVSISEMIFTGLALYWFNKHTELQATFPIIISLTLGALLYIFSLKVDFPVLFEAFVAVALFVPGIMLFRVINVSHLLWLKEKLVH